MSLTFEIQNQFSNACHVGDIESVQSILEVGLQLDPPLDIHAYQETAFRNCCKSGMLDLAKMLYGFSVMYDEPIDIHAINEDAFRSACENGDIDMAKWLYVVGVQGDELVNVDINNYNSFIISCSRGHTDLAEWLDSLGDYKEDVYNQAFSCAIYRDNSEAIRWILDKCIEKDLKIDIHYWCEFPFRSACTKGYLKIAQTLLQYGDKFGDFINIHAGGNEAFRKACQNNRIEVVEWLSSLVINYHAEIVDGKINHFEITNEFDELDGREPDDIYLNLGINETIEIMDLPECVLCLDSELEYVIELPCGHTQCPECIIQWGLKNNNKRYNCSYCHKAFRWDICKVYVREFIIRI